VHIPEEVDGTVLVSKQRILPKLHIANFLRGFFFFFFFSFMGSIFFFQAFNRALSHDDRDLRISKLYNPFHEALHAVASALTNAKAVISIRSFVPFSSPAQPESIDAVLHHTDSPKSIEACEAIASALSEWGYVVKVYAETEGLHRPYDAPQNHGHMAVVNTLADKLKCDSLLVEVRADLLKDSAWAQSFEEVLRVAMCGLYGTEPLPELQLAELKNTLNQ
jgi:predicted N-formylglutamate amidohydrolase